MHLSQDAVHGDQTVHTDVLIVGAGPAGSACAQWLAQSGAGLKVLLLDQHDFPRDKTCGDGLIPDAHAALARLGLLDEVLRAAHAAHEVRCYAPSGRHVDVDGTLAVLPRRELDHILVRAAQAAGAELRTPWRLDAVQRDAQGRVCGALFKRSGASAQRLAIRCRHLVLATGANAKSLVTAGMCQRQSPSAMGLRGYVRHSGLGELDLKLQVVWNRRIQPGYGWIFPCGAQRYNIGVGIIDSHEGGAMRALNLREVFQAFCEQHEPARRLMAEGELEGELKGAPLRNSLLGATWAQPGILVTGEAAGSTYAFTGEGIGKALETGILAAQSLLHAHQAQLDDAALSAHYSQALSTLKPKFDLYEKGNRVNRMPWLTELLIRRAQGSAKLRQRMSHVLEEKSTPAQLITWRGLYRLMVE
jgi:menaquinone-9 beta-reductase